jgi:hypothetical protein
MAKKIIIDFENQPITTGAGFGYSITVNGFDLFYNNGLSDLLVNFIPNGETPTNENQIPIGTTLEETIQITFDFLNNNYTNDLVFYSIVDNTIEVFVNADATAIIGEEINDNISITQSDVEPSGINLIYYLIYGNYRLNIYKENYNGGSSEIFGTITINKSTVDSILAPIRGTGLNISLEANQSLTFDEFLLSDEFTYKTELLKNDYIIYEGYIKPDGVQQSFVTDFWYINIESTDGLGALKDLSFVQSNGLQFTGKMSIYDVIKACLDRTRLSLTINTSINIEYTGYNGTNILKDVYVNSERFIKEGDNTVIMDCQEVLTSMLNLFSGVITQQDGQWWIYRPNDLEATGYTTFINQTDNSVFTKNLNKVLGSQINNFYPHHCENNQQIEVKGAISAYRLNYEYGFVSGFIDNPNLNHNSEMVFTDWTTNPSLPTPDLSIIDDGTSTSGLTMKSGNLALYPLLKVLTSTPIIALESQILTFRAKVSSTNVINFFIFQIKTSDGYYLENRNGNNKWTTSDASIIPVRCGAYRRSERFVSFELLMPPVIADCTIEVSICAPQIRPPSSFPDVRGLSKVSYVEILDNEIQKQGIVGENHTVSRRLPPSSITKENQKVFNGDGILSLIGSIYKEDLETVTDSWTRKGKTEALPILGISAMDDLRIQSSPIKVFSGSVFGEIPYLSVLEIDNVIGLFMATDWSYNINTNILSAKYMQFYNTDLADILYEISPDYGNSTVKPTIKG